MDQVHGKLALAITRQFMASRRRQVALASQDSRTTERLPR